MTSFRRRLQAEERRDLIVGAATRVFGERPYDDVSTAEIAEVCGVSRGLLSHYFPTKRDLYLAVVGRLLGAPELPTPPYVEGATPQERIVQGVHQWLDMVHRRREAWLAAAALMGGSKDPEIQALINRYIDATADQICEIAGIYPIRADPVVRVAMHGYAAYATIVTRRWLQGEEISREQAEQLLRDPLVTLVRETIPGLVESQTLRRST